jgi:CheY-like chemotaxis protein
VEDNAQNRYLATFLLERSGYRVTFMTDGRDVVAIAKSSCPIAILMDIRLPGLDGYAVARLLRNEPELSTVPIIAVTSYAMAGDREKALAAGCNSYIAKPIDPDTFVADIEAVLVGRPAAQP